MVEMMLMQNAQMHQILMQNMMLKALPPGPTGPRAATLQVVWVLKCSQRLEGGGGVAGGGVCSGEPVQGCFRFVVKECTRGPERSKPR